MVTTSRQLEINSIAVHPSRPDSIFIGTNNYGVMVSVDGGKSFTPTNGGYSGRFANVILPDREIANRVYASTINTATGGGFFFISTDNGESWRPSMRSMPARLIIYSIVQDITDAEVIYLGTNLGVYKSSDRGTSWAPVWANTSTVPKKPAKGRPTKSTATTARRLPAMLSSDLMLLVQESLNRFGYHLGTPDGKGGPTTTAAVKRFQGDRHLPITGNMDDLTLKALGVSRNAAADSHPDLVLTDAVNALVQFVDPETQKVGFLAATNVGLYLSVDPKSGWQKLPYGGSWDSRKTCISTSAKEPKAIWVGTAAAGVLVSRDGGKTWRQVSGVPRDMPVNTVVQDPNRPDYVYVGTKQSLYMSRDGGETWTRRGGNLPFGDFTAILINPKNGDEIFAGNAYQTSDIGGGVFRTTNGGVTWARIDPKDRRLPSQRIWALAFDPQDQNVLFVGSHSAGVYVVPRGGDSLSSSQ